MKAVQHPRFGTPDSLQVVDRELPAPGPGQVLLQVRAAGVNPYDWHVLRGDPKVARLMGVGFRRPRHLGAGIDVAGVVQAVGAGVVDLEPGEEVLGFCEGSFAEQVLADPARLVRKPAALTWEQAASLPMAGVTALQGVRDTGEVGPGTRLLVNGAGGGVGTMAVQVAVALGAEVTGVCSARNADLVRGLGAVDVVDYAREDVTGRHGAYDVVLDNVGNHPLGRMRHVLVPDGILVLNAGGSPGALVGPIGPILKATILDRFVPQRLRVLQSTGARADLLVLTGMVADGTLRPVVSRTHPLAEVAAAVRHVEQGHASGKVVLTMG